MPRFASGDKGRSHLRLDYSAENQSRCQGFYYVTVKKHGGPYEKMARCLKPHPHQVALSVDEDGNRREVPAFPFIAGLPTEEELLQSQQGECERIQRSNEARKESTSFKPLAEQVSAEDAQELIQHAVDFVEGMGKALCPDCQKTSERCVCDIPCWP